MSITELSARILGGKAEVVIFTPPGRGVTVKKLIWEFFAGWIAVRTAQASRLCRHSLGGRYPGERFLQEARACDISISGALLSGIEVDLRCGDVIGILYQGRKARYRVVWVRCDDRGDKIQAAIHRIEPDACPWQELLGGEQAPSEKVQRTEIPPDWT